MKLVIENVEKGNYGDELLVYKGKPSDDMITNLINLLDGKLNQAEQRIKIRKKIFKIAVEILQNIIHHDEKLSSLIYPSFIFYLYKKGDRYTLISCNRQVESKALAVYKKIKGFMMLSVPEQKKAYQEILGNGRFTNKGGAGLGFLEMIRSSEGNFKCDLLPSQQPGHLLLYINVSIE
jgi:hypothetical protein